MKTFVLLYLFLMPFMIIGQGSYAPAEADLSFPRSIIDASQIDEVRNTLTDPLKMELFQGIYDYANIEVPVNNVNDNDRRIRAQIAREAAFVVLMNKKVVGDTIIDLSNTEKQYLIYKVISILNSLNTEVSFQEGWSFYYTWQFRSKELINVLIAYDLLKGVLSGDDALLLARENLQHFAGNLYSRSMYLYPNPIPGFPDIDFYFYNPNNHGVMVSAALGLAGIVLGDCESEDPNYQPYNWIQTGIWNLDNLLWRVDGLLPRVSDPNVIAGYAEGPNYFQYGFQNAFPFIRAMWNFLPDQAFEYEFRGETRTINNPWYDTNYHNLYKWMVLIRMPDGRSPAIHDSSASFATNMPALSGISDYNIPVSSNNYNELWTRSQYISTNVEQSLSLFDEPLFQVLPYAGSLVFRTTFNDPSGIYLHLIGKHGIALWGAKAHHQADAMSFQLYYNNHIFAIEEGYVGSNYREYVNKATDHNLILVDGKGPKSPMSEWVSDDNEVYIEDYFDIEKLDYGELTGGWEGADITRKTLFVDNQYFIMWDFVESSQPKVYQYQLHCSGLENNVASHPNGTVTLDSNEHRVSLSKDENHLLVHTEITDPSPSYSLALDSVYNGNATFYHNKFLATSSPLSKTQFTSILYPYTGSEPIVQPIETASNGKAILIDRNSNLDLVFTQGENEFETISYDNNFPSLSISTNANATLVSINDMFTPQFLFIENGDSLFLNNKQILAIDRKANLSIEFLEDNKINGYINSEAILYIGSDTSLVSTDGSLSDIFYDPIKKMSIIHFSSPTYFSLEIGDAIITSIPQANQHETRVSAYPNPTKGRSTLEIESNQANEIVLNIIDEKGSIVSSQDITLSKGNNQIPINLSRLPKGIYTLLIVGDQLSKSLIISHF